LISEYIYNDGLIAGCDEAGRGCLAGPVFAAAVILPAGFSHPQLNDSKKINESTRSMLRDEIISKAVSWAVASCDESEIDKLNILWASVKAMHLAVGELNVKPDLLLIDGNRFKSYSGIDHQCVVNGDALYSCISAASILAKTFRDDWMKKLALQHPSYGWESNKGYGTQKHLHAIRKNGITAYHRKSFKPVHQYVLDI
jgi:ribonuclease HII